MRRGSMFVFLPATGLLLAGGSRTSPPPVVPGGKIGTMILVGGIERKADDEIWRYCKSATPKPGRYRRTCSVPHIERPFIGDGDWGAHAEVPRLRVEAVDVDSPFRRTPRQLVTLRHLRARAVLLPARGRQERDPA